MGRVSRPRNITDAHLVGSIPSYQTNHKPEPGEPWLMVCGCGAEIFAAGSELLKGAFAAHRAEMGERSGEVFRPRG